MDIIRDTIQQELKHLNVRGTLSNVVITKTRSLDTPWTASYIRYDDGKIGCGLANNEMRVPDDVAFIWRMLNRDAYEVIDELIGMGRIAFINSTEQSDRCLPMILRHCYKLIQYPPFTFPIRLPIPPPNCFCILPDAASCHPFLQYFGNTYFEAMPILTCNA